MDKFSNREIGAYFYGQWVGIGIAVPPAMLSFESFDPLIASVSVVALFTIGAAAYCARRSRNHNRKGEYQ